MNEAIGRFHLESAIAHAKGRNASRTAQQFSERAANVRDGAAEFITERPFTAIAGALAVGVLIGALLPRPRLGKGAGTLAGMMTKAGMDYGRQAFGKAFQAYQARANGAGADNAIFADDNADTTDQPKRSLLGRFGR